MHTWEPMDPESPAEFYQEPEAMGTGGLTFAPVFSGEMFGKVVAYPVIVESWEKRRAGRVKRAYIATFTEGERKTLSKWQGKFYRWYLVTGTPKRVMLRLKTLALLQRAVTFFASC